MDRLVVVGSARTRRSVSVPRDGSANVYVLDLLDGDSDVRVRARLARGARCSVVLSAFGSGKARKTFRIAMDHEGSDGSSKCAFYGVAGGRASLEVVARTDIRKGTTNTVSSQTIKGIMLSNEATIHGEPQLIIDDNNVKAAHALGVGRINPEHLFYLQSRGLSRAQSVHLLVSGFFNEVVARIPDGMRKKRLLARIERLVG